MITQAAPFTSSIKMKLAVAFLAFAPVIASLSVARAENGNSNDLVSSLPAQIPEILTGGSWTNGSVGGVYRAVVVLSKSKNSKSALLNKAVANKPSTVENSTAGERKAEVFIQWIAYGTGKATAKIVKTVSIKEFNEKQLRHAFLAMDTLKDNEMTLLVTSYDENSDKDVSISVKATTPGQYTSAKTGK